MAMFLSVPVLKCTLNVPTLTYETLRSTSHPKAIFDHFALWATDTGICANFQKVYGMTPIDLNILKLKKNRGYTVYTPVPGAQIFICLAQCTQVSSGGGWGVGQL